MRKMGNKRMKERKKKETRKKVKRKKGQKRKEKAPSKDFGRKRNSARINTKKLNFTILTMHKSESVPKKETFKIFLDFDIRVDRLNRSQARRPSLPQIDQKKKSSLGFCRGSGS